MKCKVYVKWMLNDEKIIWLITTGNILVNENKRLNQNDKFQRNYEINHGEIN